MKVFQLPANRIGCGDVILQSVDGLIVGHTVWNYTKDGEGNIKFYYRESTTFQITVHESEIISVVRDVGPF